MTIRRGTGLIGGSFTGESIRPAGYQFPVGLSAAPAGSSNVVYSFTSSGTWTVQIERAHV